MLKINAEIKDSQFICKLENTPKENGYSYAYYLYLDNERIETVWYCNDKTKSFKLNKSGVYHVVFFIKKGENDPKIIKSDTFNFISAEERMKLSIFGSCVSRDILEMPSNNFITLKSYIARQSVVSSVSKPIDISIDDIKLESNFQKKMVYNDIAKKTFEILSSDESEFLLLDMIDERFEVAKFQGTIITTSNEFDLYSTDYKLLKLKKEIIFSDIKTIRLVQKILYYKLNKWVKYNKYLKSFIEKINKIYKLENIILHKAYMLDEYIDNDGKIQKFDDNIINYNRRLNDKLRYMYEYIENKMPNCKVIDICYKYKASENHKWGLSPMHYEEAYYKECIEIISKY